MRDDVFLTPGVWRVFVSGYALAVAAILLMPQPVVEALTTDAFRGHNKAIHCLLFVPLGFGTVPALPHLRCPGVRAVIATGMVMVYGALLEGLQGLLPVLQRGFSWHDIAANGLGAALGVLAATTVFGLGKKRSRQHKGTEI